MQIVGIDLSGISNSRDTCLVYFQEHTGRLTRLGYVHGADDQRILETVAQLAPDDPIVVGIDAPLSYNISGSDRPGDRALRQAIRAAGMRSGSVMTPTMPRMVYLTLRGLGVCRCLESLRTRQRSIQIVEVHPGATMALRGAPINAVLELKRDIEAQRQLLLWLEAEGLDGVMDIPTWSDHYVAACAAALAAWKWCRNETVWCTPAQPPYHPYDFAC